MKCEEIRTTISAELDGEAADEQLIPAYSHLVGCPDCRRWRREILVTKGTFAFLEDRPLPPAITERLRQSEKAARSVKRRQSGSIYRIRRPLVWAAAALILVQIGWSSFQLAGGPQISEFSTDYEVPDRIILTAQDRTLSSTIVRIPEENK